MNDAVRTVVLNRVLMREGGTSDHPHDGGGLTRCGLTRPFLRTVTGRIWSDAEIRRITREIAVGVYATWLEQTHLDTLPDHVGLCDAVTDYAVHSGERIAIGAAQKALGLTADGLAGPVTQAAWRGLEDGQSEDLRLAIHAERMRHWSRIFQKKSDQRVFAAGWLNRMADLVRG